jgi:hypothetical protein
MNVDFSNYTFAKKGSRRVKATTSGNERTRLSAAFSSTASGLKLPIFLIVPRKTDLPDYEPPEECILKYKTGGTINNDVIVEYIDRVLIPFKLNIISTSHILHLTQLNVIQHQKYLII